MEKGQKYKDIEEKYRLEHFQRLSGDDSESVATHQLHMDIMDMLKQMKNVRNMPTSASGVNSQGGRDNDVDRDVFNSILGFDSDTDNLFG